MSASTISATDVEVFKRLSNPAVVDVQVESRTRRATVEMRQALDKAATAVKASTRATPDDEDAASPAASSASSGRAEKTRSSFRIAQEEVAEEQRKTEEWEAATETRERQEAQPRVAATPAPERSRTSAQAPAPRSTTAPIQEEEEEDDEEEEEAEHRRRPDSRRGTEGERLEKQGFLIELSNLKQKGIVLSRDFGMDDTLAELEFEVQKQNNNITTRHNVTFMRDMMRIAINGIEIGNNRFGPFLSIDGWAESVTQDMSKYEHVLERLYKRYWRKSQMSPIMELAWLLVGSMVAWHFKSKFFGPPSASASGRQNQNVSAPIPVPTTGRASAPTVRGRTGQNRPATARPILRPPSALFGF